MKPWSVEECAAYAKQLRDKSRANTAEHAAQAIEYLLGLVQAEQVQPVGEVLNERGEVDWISFVPPAGALLYTAPPPRKPWVGLADEDIYKMTILMGFNPEWKPEVEMVYSVVRNLEAKLKEKNTSPPPRRPLTDEEIEDLYFDRFSMGELKAFARAIEAAHGITKGEV